MSFLIGLFTLFATVVYLRKGFKKRPKEPKGDRYFFWFGD